MVFNRIYRQNPNPVQNQSNMFAVTAFLGTERNSYNNILYRISFLFSSLSNENALALQMNSANFPGCTGGILLIRDAKLEFDVASKQKICYIVI